MWKHHVLTTGYISIFGQIQSLSDAYILKHYLSVLSLVLVRLLPPPILPLPLPEDRSRKYSLNITFLMLNLGTPFMFSVLKLNVIYLQQKNS